ncbi:hypothetical protein KF728_15205 [Candidatus Obscuribacterales bacterium]|nr:hypothetical protein [Candidatus Obscuribacterales bacterium]
MLTEIVGDLYRQDDKSIEETHRKVQLIANKILTFSACKQIDYRDLRDQSLLGNEMFTGFRPAIQSTEIFDGEDGQSIAYISESVEMKMIHDWQRGHFNAEDHDYAKEWKETSRVDLTSYKSQLLPIPALAGLTSLREIYQKMDAISQIMDQWLLIESFCKRIKLPIEMNKKIENRWKDSKPLFCEFAPYAYYCYLIEQVFYQGLASGLIPTSVNAKSYVDLQYAYYFPYSRVFSSNDKLHKQLWQAFANHDQQLFVVGSELKDDVRKISAHWQNISEAERSELRKVKPHPPVISPSFTFEAYEKMSSVVGTREQKLRPIERTEEETRATVDRILANYDKVRRKFERER